MLIVPELVLAIVGLVTGEPGFGWSALAVGLVLGAALLTIGIRWGGTILERRGPELLTQLQNQK